jgi:phenylacetate-CoA ligase
MKVLSYIRARAEHKRNASRSRAEILARQLAKFRRLVAHANRRSPYYRDLIASRGIDVGRCVPGDFPPLTKSEAMANFDRIVTDQRLNSTDVGRFIMESKDPLELLHNRYTVIHTSGTSGEIGCFVFSPDDWARGAANSGRLWPSPKLRRRRFAYYGAAQGHTGGVTSGAAPQRFWARLGFRAILCSVQDSISDAVDALNRFQPDILTGLPSYLMLLVEEQQRGALKISPDYVMTGGEVVTDTTWDSLETTFGAKVLDVYGSSEHMTMGVKDGIDGGTVLYEDDLIFEMEEKRTLVSNLFNFTFPLIRYVMDDVLVPLDDLHPVLPFAMVRLIGGRPERRAVFTNPDGVEVAISPSVFEQFFVPDLRRFQLEVVDMSSCLFRVTLDPDLSEERRSRAFEGISDRLDQIFAKYALPNVSFSVEEVDNFGSGKFQLVVIREDKPALPFTVGTRSVGAIT